MGFDLTLAHIHVVFIVRNVICWSIDDVEVVAAQLTWINSINHSLIFII